MVAVTLTFLASLVAVVLVLLGLLVITVFGAIPNLLILGIIGLVSYILLTKGFQHYTITGDRFGLVMLVLGLFGAMLSVALVMPGAIQLNVASQATEVAAPMTIESLLMFQPIDSTIIGSMDQPWLVLIAAMALVAMYYKGYVEK